jgi:hypothetical protein
VLDMHACSPSRGPDVTVSVPQNTRLSPPALRNALGAKPPRHDP